MIHCQNCTRRNSMDRQFCWKCGARLLVTSGNVHSEHMTPMDEHVLERISALEYAVSGLTRQVEALNDSVERVGANNFIDHTMIETLTEALETAGIDLSNLEEDWRRRIDLRVTENEEIDRLGRRMDAIIAAYRGPRRKSFTMWMERAYEQIASERPNESVVSLESAMAEDPANEALAMLLAEVCFDSGQFSAAGGCLGKILERHPEHFEATLLLGLVEQRHGHVSQAEQLLERAVTLREDSHAAHASLGSLFVDRGQSHKAQTHLTRALELKPTAPVHYLLGSVYRDTGRQRRAFDQFRRATELDPEFGQAFYAMGLVCQEMKWSRKAEECFRRARGLGSAQSADSQNPRRKPSQRAMSGCRPKSNPIDPDFLNGLVREELEWTRSWDPKRAK